jgi:transcriptional regulator with XRE-family HTH domain
MDDQRVGRTILVLRQRRGWRQVDLAERAGVSQSAISDMERGRIARYTVATTRRVLAAFGASATLDVTWAGRGDLDRLLDADHARLVHAWTERHLRAGWEVWNEASYSIYGERGRIDLLAFHPSTGTLEVAECKSGIWDIQDTLGRLDVKVRLAPTVAAQRQWTAHRVIGALAVAEGRTARRRITEHEVLFRAFDTRGRSALAFVANPVRPARGLLAFIPLARTNQSGLRRAGQRRVRRRLRDSSVGGAT